MQVQADMHFAFTHSLLMRTCIYDPRTHTHISYELSFTQHTTTLLLITLDFCILIRLAYSQMKFRLPIIIHNCTHARAHAHMRAHAQTYPHHASMHTLIIRIQTQHRSAQNYTRHHGLMTSASMHMSRDTYRNCFRKFFWFF